MVPLARIERATSPLPRECSTTELQRRIPLLPLRALPIAPRTRPRLAHGAGEGNRTLVVSLEGFCSTIELHPHLPPFTRMSPSNGRRPKPSTSSGGGGRIRTFEGESRQIYSLIPLTAREPLRTKLLIMLGFLCCVKLGWHASRLLHLGPLQTGPDPALISAPC